MRSLAGTTPWKTLDAALRASTDRYFEREVLPLSRAFWPGMVQTPDKGVLDRAGIDLVVFGEKTFDCVIQCKGTFKAEGLVDDQFGLIRDSIASFRDSPYVTREYLLIHNQDGRNEALAKRIDAELETLVAAGRAEMVRQWDRHSFLEALQQQLWTMIKIRTREHSALMLEQLDSRFEISASYVPDVPVLERELLLRRQTRPQIIERDAGASPVRIAERLARPSARWTLLTGLFGSGKTSAALTAANQYPETVLYTSAAIFEPRQGDAGTSTIMVRILESLHIFAEFEQDDRLMFERLGAPMLRKELAANKSSAVLIIDALDENGALWKPAAITQFANALTSLTCPIIMTTREEHFRATFGNFEHMFDELSHRAGRSIRLLELGSWGHEQIVELVAGALSSRPGDAGLTLLLENLRRGDYGGWNGEMLGHPFFLRMIVELAAHGVPPSDEPAELIGNWARLKLIRDLRSARATPILVTDRDAFIESCEQIMERVAGMMVVAAPDGYELADSIASTQVIAIAEEVLRLAPLELGPVLSVSLLIPTAVRFRDSIPVRFTHRAIQELYTARHLRRIGADCDRYPPQVKEFWAGLRSSTDLRPHR